MGFSHAKSLRALERGAGAEANAIECDFAVTRSSLAAKKS